MTVVVTIAVVTVVDGTVTMLVNVLGGLSPPPFGISGLLLSLCWAPMNRPMKIELNKRKASRRMSNILLRGVNGS